MAQSNIWPAAGELQRALESKKKEVQIWGSNYLGDLENGDPSPMQLVHLQTTPSSQQPQEIQFPTLSSQLFIPTSLLTLSLTWWPGSTIHLWDGKMPCDAFTLAVLSFLIMPCHYPYPYTYPGPGQGDRLVQASCACTMTRETFPRKLCQGSDQLHFQAEKPYLVWPPETCCEFCK